MFIVDPGDMIFVPMFVWRTYPVEQKLDTDIELMEIRLTKAETVVQEKLHGCNGNKNYIYGSKRVFLAAILRTNNCFTSISTVM